MIIAAKIFKGTINTISIYCRVKHPRFNLDLKHIHKDPDCPGLFFLSFELTARNISKYTAKVHGIFFFSRIMKLRHYSEITQTHINYI